MYRKRPLRGVERGGEGEGGGDGVRVFENGEGCRECQSLRVGMGREGVVKGQ